MLNRRNRFAEKLRNVFRRLKQRHVEEPCYPTVSLIRWRSPRGYPNFGDDLGYTIVTLLLAKHMMTMEDESLKRFKLLSIGSIMHLACDGAVVWGSGINGKVPQEIHRFTKLDVRMVRGPYSREWLKEKRGIEAPEVYGDPALMLPALAGGRFKQNAREGFSFVPNLNDVILGHFSQIPTGVRLVSPMQSWHRVVSAVVRSRFVVSSSLHGIVIAEAFGIPARYARISGAESLFKYQDYYAGTGRPVFDYADSISEALEMGGEDPPIFDVSVMERAFPFDLWML